MWRYRYAMPSYQYRRPLVRFNKRTVLAKLASVQLPASVMILDLMRRLGEVNLTNSRIGSPSAWLRVSVRTTGVDFGDAEERGSAPAMLDHRGVPD
jgi:hypothetical protein